MSTFTAPKTKLFITDFFSKFDQIRDFVTCTEQILNPLMHNLTRFETAVSEFEEFVKNTILLQIMHMKSGFFHIEIELNLIRFA